MKNLRWRRALNSVTKSVAVIGGGPSGLFAAEILSAAGFAVTVYEQKPSLGRKFLMAGRGGLNLTHSEDFENFTKRYGDAAPWLRNYLENFTPAQLRAWCEGLGEPTFIGTSGRIFPQAFKASPLLRKWMTRLENRKVEFKLNHRWRGWGQNDLAFDAGGERIKIKTDAVLLALGGASWPRLGSDGHWTEILEKKNISIVPLRPANCGFVIEWSEIFRSKFVGLPVKPIALSFADQRVQGEIMLTQYGIEGGPVYALSAALRDAIEKSGSAELQIDLKPNVAINQLIKTLQKPRGANSFTNYLRRTLSLSAPAIGLLMEREDRAQLGGYAPEKLAALIKSLPVKLIAPSGIERAISTAGGIALDELDQNLMLKKLPGVFAAGEMLDWEAPTGGYLLQGCFATGAAAARGIISFLR